MRLSPAVQLRFSAAETSGGGDWLDVAAEVQAEVLREFGIAPTPKALRGLRLAAPRIGLSLYVRHNRARRGDLEVGDDAPDVALVDLEGRRVRLGEYQKKGRPLVVLAGSYS